MKCDLGRAQRSVRFLTVLTVLVAFRARYRGSFGNGGRSWGYQLGITATQTYTHTHTHPKNKNKVDMADDWRNILTHCVLKCCCWCVFKSHVCVFKSEVSVPCCAL